MNCEEARVEFVAAAFGDADARAGRDLVAHLESCERCRGEANDADRTVAFMKETARQGKAAEQELTERAERLKARLVGMLDQEFARQDAEKRSRKAAAIAPPPPIVVPPLRLPYGRRVVKALAAIAAVSIAAVVVVEFATSPDDTPPAAPTVAQLERGTVAFSLTPSRAVRFDAAGVRFWTVERATGEARIWLDRTRFLKEADMKTREWLVASGLVAAAFPMLQVSLREGSAVLENRSGKVEVFAGETAIAPANGVPAIRPEASRLPFATIEGMVGSAGAKGPVTIEIFDFDFLGGLGPWKPCGRFESDDYGQFSFPILREGLYLVLPADLARAAVPSRAAIVACGESVEFDPRADIVAERLPGECVVTKVRAKRGETVALTLELQPAGTVRGFVRDADGKPCAGVRVTARNGRADAPLELTTVSGTDGSYEIRSVLGPFDVNAEAEGNRLARAEGTARPHETVEIDLVVEAVLPIHGRVLRADGRPVAGARVCFADVGDFPFLLREIHEGTDFGIETTSRADGSFEFSRMRWQPEPYRLFAALDSNLAGWSGEVDPRRIPEGGARVVVGPSPSLRGRVLDGEGRPVSATVTLRDPAEVGISLAIVSTDAQGKFRILHLLPWTYSIDVTRTGHPAIRRIVQVGEAGADVEIVVGGKTRPVTLRVVGRGGATLPDSFGPSEGEAWRHPLVADEVRIVVTSADPRAGAVPDEAVVRWHWPFVGDAPPIELPGEGRLWVALTLCGRVVYAREYGGEADVAFEVDPTVFEAEPGAVDLRARDGHGTPLRALVEVQPAEGGPAFTRYLFPGRALGPLLPGEYRLTVSATGYAGSRVIEGVRVEAGKAAGPVEITLGR